jgi:hypothetical protein
MNDKNCALEIESLNLDDLDVEELEHRLEMAVIGPPVTNGCDQNGGCYINT